MTITEFIEAEHKDHLVSWLEKRNLPKNLAEDLPTIGLIAFKDSLPIAVAFLRQTEGNLGIFDGLCTNPDAPAHMRHFAIDKLTAEIIDIAKDFEFTAIIAWSEDAGTLERSVKHGFRRMPQSLIAIDLRNKSAMH